MSLPVKLRRLARKHGSVYQGVYHDAADELERLEAVAELERGRRLQLERVIDAIAERYEAAALELDGISFGVEIVVPAAMYREFARELRGLTEGI